MGRGFLVSVLTKQKLNTRSSTDSELVGVDDMMPIICWTRYFLLSQGCGIIENLLLQENKAQSYWSKMGKPQVASAQGILTFDTPLSRNR